MSTAATRPQDVTRYVATFARFVYVGFAIDVFPRMIVHWRGR